jgi:hypothetical protein
MELLVTDRRGLIHIHRNFGDQRPPVLMEPRTLTRDSAPFVLPDARTTIVAADLDLDGRDELVFGTSEGRLFSIHAGSSRLELRNEQPLLQEFAPFAVGGHAVVAAGELFGAGLDLVAGDAIGRLHLFRDNGGREAHRYWLPLRLEAGGAPFQLDPGPDGMIEGPVRGRLGFSCPALVDWTGHGRLDVLLGGAGGEVLLLRNDGAAHDPRFGSPVPIRCEGRPLITPPRVRPAAIDGDGDGRADLITLDLQGMLCCHRRIASYEVGRGIPLLDRLGRTLRLDGAFSQAGRCSLWAGPWCGTENADILVGLPRSNQHVIAAICGLACDDIQLSSTVLLLENLGNGQFCPRPLLHADGRALLAGFEGCSPSGVNDGTADGLDLLVGSDDGSVQLLRRRDLRW